MWPVTATIIRLDALKRDRDQLWAEAYARFKSGAVSWIEDKHVLREAFEEQEKRRSSDPWTDVIAEYLETNEVAVKYGLITAKDLWTYALKGQEVQFQRIHAHRIGNCLRSLGWTYGAHHHPGKKETVRCFRKIIDPLMSHKAEEDIFA